MESDRKTGLKTLPIIAGVKRSLMLATLALGLFSSITLLHYYSNGQLCFSLAFLISGISTIIFLNSKKISGLPHYHYGILDGTMILQALLLIVCYYL
jgi:4-hydroxybenzoate polyprenyltransferase